MIRGAAKKTLQTQKKSGLRTLKSGDILFHENDHAESLFIIQKGQLRLFRPKGKGYIEIAILRSGEVIGEMAYFDEKARKRSCSAEAIVSTDVIEVSFKAFGKTLEGLNPWFKTIINTLAQRLRKTNDTVRELESNSVSFGRGGKVPEYKFFGDVDILRGCSILYLVMKSHGDLKGSKMVIHMNRLKFYFFDVFNYSEIKYEELIQLLQTQKILDISNDKDNLPNIVGIKNVECLKDFMRFFNLQRVVDQSEELIISNKCERFLKRIYDQLIAKDSDKDHVVADLSIILKDFSARNVPITEEDLQDSIEAGIVGEIIVDDGNKLIAEVNYLKLKELFPSIVFMNEVKKLNEIKAHGKS
ncbi:MAG: cyclic nucleotide-binding domain-containing protein [Bacteriovoracaceae bacterium]|nr:cyclic nucleotide-binding domain-containing protein [Bacteriovoracaceae bacterium]